VRDPRRLEALRRQALLDTPPEEEFDRLTRLASRLIGLPVALVSLVDADRQFFKSCVGVPEPWAGRRESPLSHSFCQHVVDGGKPLVVRDARRHAVLRHNAAVSEMGMIAYAGFPLFAEGHVIGTLCAIDDVPRDWSPEDLEVIADLAALAQSELDLREAGRAARGGRRRAEQAREIAEHDKAVAESAAAVLSRLTALTDAVLAAADLDEMLRRAAAEARRSFGADAALVAVEHDYASAGLPVRDETMIEVGRRLLGGVGSGEVAAFEDLGEEARGSLRAVLAAPLPGSGLLLVASAAARQWTELERHLLRLAADRLGVALGQARLHDRVRLVGETLQRALLPTHLPRVPGVELAARLEPAEPPMGGDWYDAFALPGRRVGLVVGDVVGHGIESAAAAVQLRHLVRGFVLGGHGPAAVIAGLDALVEVEGHAEFSSVLYAELDLPRRRMRWATAGHVPPVLVRDRKPRVLDSPGGTLLGVQPAAPCPERTDELRSGDRIVLYTDGLVERPGEPLDVAIKRMFGLCAAAREGLEALCDALLEARPRPRRDDTAILAASIM
jgi:serine phosphatase RsbU (regulator of sigma subunit)